ncbi:MAG: substrate-binding domain-containing protein [Anaerolineae bacterium]|nr:substrate-binding domain-containing protein [Anaerolineae bacterium]
MGRARRALVIAAFTLASCSTQMVPASTPTSDAIILRLYTTTSTAKLVDNLTRVYVRSHPHVSFDILASNYDAAVQRVNQERASYFVTNHLPPPDQTPLWGAPIGQDGIAIITNPKNPVSNLSLQQLREIYQGRLANWQAVGGDDRVITVVSRETGSGTRAEFDSLVMGERQTTQSALVAPSSMSVVVSVSRDEQAIGYVSMSYLDPGVRALTLDDTSLNVNTVYDNTYPLRTTLFIAGQEEPTSEEYRAFIGWVQSPEGQRIVARTHAPLLLPETTD